MTRKIFIGVVSVSLIIMLVCAGLVTGILYDYMGEKLDDQLAGEAVLVEEGWLTGGEDYLTGLEARTSQAELRCFHLQEMCCMTVPQIHIKWKTICRGKKSKKL